MMGTYVTIHAIGPKETASKAIDLALDRLQEIDIKFNYLNPKSQIYAFNNQGTPISDPELIGLIDLALKASRESEGAFDITVAPLAELWSVYGKSPRVPEEGAISECLKNVGYHHLSLTNGKLEKDSEGVKIDLGGIAKGYAINEAVKTLKANGASSALVDVGGDIYALGRNGKRLWKVGIKDPRGTGLIGYIEVEDLAVMSSGDYERFFIEDGRRYHHILNPKTGYPTEGVAAVTLIYSDPISAQAWAKVPFILGARRGMDILERIPGMEVIIITAAGERLYSSAMKHMLMRRSDKERKGERDA